MPNKLFEDTHIYVDDATGDQYVFDGTNLIKIKSGSPLSIGDKGDEDELAKEDEEREKQASSERAEDGEEAESEEQKQSRLAKIKKFLDDSDVENQIKNDTYQKVKQEKDRIKAAQERELRKNLKGQAKNNAVIKELSSDLQRFLAKQVGKSVRNASWKKYNGNYDGSGIVRPGYRYEKVGKIPVIQIYIDQSGSFTDAEVKMGKEILNSILEFERKKLLKSEVYYFANNIHSSPEPARAEGGTGAGTQMMEQINATKPDNVIVLTDDDFDSWGLTGSYEAPGGVWLIFRDSRSRSLMDNLKGKLMTKYYDIDRVRGE